MQIYQKSKLDFSTAKTAFTTGVFTLESDQDLEGSSSGNDCQILTSFYSLLMQKAESVTPDSTAKADDSLNVDKILHLKQSSNSMTHFSDESH
mmetsp:Transcript_30320/g.40286  ORF Transcript_30320/g.40286 Transcript_30320/m.40286 type:complete len:93 (-) Transcript_30320:56-334(-)